MNSFLKTLLFSLVFKLKFNFPATNRVFQSPANRLLCARFEKNHGYLYASSVNATVTVYRKRVGSVEIENFGPLTTKATALFI